MTLNAPVPTGEIRVRVFRCRLADEMVVRLRTVPAADRLVEVLALSTPAGAQHSIYGPDLNVPDLLTCHDGRLSRDCRPRFAATLGIYSLDESVPGADSL